MKRKRPSKGLLGHCRYVEQLYYIYEISIAGRISIAELVTAGRKMLELMSN